MTSKILNHRIITSLLFTSCLFISAITQAANTIPTAPKLAAKGYVLLDFNSGQIIAENKSDQRMEPASLTKMMSTYVISHELKAGNISLQDKVTISKKAWRMPGSRMFVEVGKQVDVESLLKGIIIQSGNDATVAMSEFVAGSEDAFASLMNNYAQQLGMLGTHFVNSTGLPDKEHYTTPRDMAILGSALIRDFPEHYKWYAIKKYTFNNITQYNRNKLLWRDKSVDGIKTGHTESAGFCLVSSGIRDDMRLVSVVLGTKSDSARVEESQKLLSYGFRFFRSHKLYDANTEISTTDIWKGTKDSLSLGLLKELYVTIPRGQYKKLKPSINFESIIEAPINKHQVLGNLTVKLNDKIIAERKLVALHEIEQGNWWKRLVDWFVLLIKGWFG
ncbi:MAG: D-alanyl-D-alanine carboxypeptidase [Sulfuriflexus sp.]|nr:D-alanyl-D-alanine carboxypeptidase [Sulfuriflexus sp.]